MSLHRALAVATMWLIVLLGVAIRANAYVIVSKWPQDPMGAPVALSFSYSNLLDGGLPGLTAEELQSATIEGLQLWSAVAPLEYTQMVDSGPPPSNYNYVASTHPKLRMGHYALSGGSTLARSYFPSVSGMAGDTHFSSRFNWGLNTGTVNGVFYYDLIEVATHESGHALGLDHVTDVASIMEPTHQNLFNGLTTGYLFADDIAGIQANYGVGFGSVLDLAGRLYLSGTEDANAITVDVSGGNLVGGSAGIGSFNRDYSTVKALEINARGGADAIYLNNLTPQVADARLLYGTANVQSGTVTHGGSASDVDGYNWSSATVRLQSGSLLVRGDEAGATSGGSASFVQSGGSHWVQGSLRVGDSAGQAAYTMEGGTLDVGLSAGTTDTLAIGCSTLGAFTQTGGTVSVHSGRLILGVDASGEGVYNLQGGTLDLLQHDVAWGAGAGAFHFTGGKLTNVATFDGDLDQQGGTLAAGASPGVMTITGDYTLDAGGKLEVELAGSGKIAGSDYDFYNVLGNASLGGALEVRLLEGFAPAAGDAFNILDWGSLSSSFSVLQLPALSGTLQWDTSKLYTIGVLAVIDGLFGDLNDDGLVNAADVDALWSIVRGGGDPNGNDNADLDGSGLVNEDDLDFLLANLTWGDPNSAIRYGDADLDGSVTLSDYNAWRTGQSGWAQGDFDGDGQTSISDYVLWASEPTQFPGTVGSHGSGFGASAQSSGESELVPEPSSLVLLGAALPVLLMARRWRRKTPAQRSLGRASTVG